MNYNLFTKTKTVIKKDIDGVEYEATELDASEKWNRLSYGNLWNKFKKMSSENEDWKVKNGVYSQGEFNQDYSNRESEIREFKTTNGFKVK